MTLRYGVALVWQVRDSTEASRTSLIFRKCVGSPRNKHTLILKVHHSPGEKEALESRPMDSYYANSHDVNRCSDTRLSGGGSDKQDNARAHLCTTTTLLCSRSEHFSSPSCPLNRGSWSSVKRRFWWSRICRMVAGASFHLSQ